jgi:formate hydrogenlyase subunit 4
MSRLAGLVAELLHIGLIAVAAPTLVGLCAWFEARISGRGGFTGRGGLTGRGGPPLLQPWRELLRLSRKHGVMAESASAVSRCAPLACLAATAVAACLIPSFTLDMIFAPLGDLVAIAGLLAVAWTSLALAAVDAGTAQGGMDASRTMSLFCLSEAALLLVAFVLALLTGSLNLDLIASQQMEVGLNWPAGLALAFAALVLITVADTIPSPGEFSGMDLALIEAASALRLLVWFDLIGVMFLPFGMTSADAGPAGWLLGIVCWLVRLVVFAAALSLARAMLGRFRLRRAARVLGVAVAISLAAALFVLAGMGSA